MFGYKYRYELTDEPGVIKLAPTKGTYAKAWMPTLVLMVFWGSVIGILSRKWEREIDEELNNLPEDE